jgi:transaldolase
MHAFLLLLVIAGILTLHETTSFSPEFRGASRLFLDTADTLEWKELLPTGIFHGVTCNPTLLERAGETCTIDNLHDLAKQALDYNTINEFMCQAWGSTSQGMYDCGMALSEPDRDRIVVKVPVTMTGVTAARMLIQSNVRVCLTACYNRKQAMIAANVGAEYIAPYLGRMTDAGLDGAEECLKMQEIVDGLQADTRILVASIRRCQDMANLAADGGMETFTFSPAVARELFTDSMTDKAAAEFEAAAARNC